MSDMEAHKGKLVPMDLTGNSLDELAENACMQLGLGEPDDNETWVEHLRDKGYRKIYIHGDIIYLIQNTELDAFGFTEADKNSDGSINYVMFYYNGGASFDEALDGAVERLEDES